MLDVKAKNRITIWRKEIYYTKVKCHIKLFKDLINPPPRSGEGIIGMHFVRRPSVTFRVHSITYIRIGGLPSNLVQRLSSLRRCAVALTPIHTSNVKVTQDNKGRSTHARAVL